MKNLTINDKINIRSNMPVRENKSLKNLIENYKISSLNKAKFENIYTENNTLCLFYYVMPCNTQNQLLKNKNFQQSYK